MLAYCAQEEVVGRWYSGVWKKVFTHFYGGKKLINDNNKVDYWPRE